MINRIVTRGGGAVKRVVAKKRNLNSVIDELRDWRTDCMTRRGMAPAVNKYDGTLPQLTEELQNWRSRCASRRTGELLNLPAPTLPSTQAEPPPPGDGEEWGVRSERIARLPALSEATFQRLLDPSR